MMDRRAFIVIATQVVLAAPRIGEGQPARRLPRVGILRPSFVESPTTSLMRAALSEVGYHEGQNIVIEWRYAENRDDNFRKLSSELVALNVDALVTTGRHAGRALMHATKTIPIIVGSDDLVEEGLVSSLARPGANV